MSVFYLLSVRGEPPKGRREKSLEDTIRHPSVEDLDKRFLELAEHLEGWSEDTHRMMKSLASPRIWAPANVIWLP